MYGTAGRGLGIAVGTGGAGATLAMTGFSLASMIVLGLVVLVIGVALVRFAGVRRPDGGQRPADKSHVDSVTHD